MTNGEKSFKLVVKGNAIICPVCRRKLRGVRLLPGTVIKDASLMCHDCRAVMIVNIDKASATFSPRR